MSGGAGAPTL